MFSNNGQFIFILIVLCAIIALLFLGIVVILYNKDRKDAKVLKTIKEDILATNKLFEEIKETLNK